MTRQARTRWGMGGVALGLALAGVTPAGLHGGTAHAAGICKNLALCAQSSATSSLLLRRYTVHDLGDYPGDGTGAYAINGGQVVGSTAVGTDPNSSVTPTYHAVRFNWATTRLNYMARQWSRVFDYGTLGGLNSYALGLNSAGQVVGYGYMGDNQTMHAFRTEPNAAIDPAADDLGSLTDANGTSWATAINDAGQVAGSSFTADGQQHAFRTEPNAAIDPSTDDLGTLISGWESDAAGINSSGQVAGTSFIYDGHNTYERAFRTQPNAPIDPSTDDLGTLGGQSLQDTEARGLNDSGQVVGWSYTPDDSMHAYRTQPNAPINPATDDLGTLGGWDSAADGINAGGQVVGWSETSDWNEHAFLYDSRGMHDLNALLPDGTGWTLTEAEAIDNAGNIVGIGLYKGQPRGFLLTLSA